MAIQIAEKRVEASVSSVISKRLKSKDNLVTVTLLQADIQEALRLDVVRPQLIMLMRDKFNLRWKRLRSHANNINFQRNIQLRS